MSWVFPCGTAAPGCPRCGTAAPGCPTKEKPSTRSGMRGVGTRRRRTRVRAAGKALVGRRLRLVPRCCRNRALASWPEEPLDLPPAIGLDDGRAVHVRDVRALEAVAQLEESGDRGAL